VIVGIVAELLVDDVLLRRASCCSMGNHNEGIE
jgi:hypothetical protein